MKAGKVIACIAAVCLGYLGWHYLVTGVPLRFGQPQEIPEGERLAVRGW